MKILTVLFLALLGACAQVPPCAPFEAHSVVVEGQYFVILDEANVRKLGAMIEGMAAGACTLPK